MTDQEIINGEKRIAKFMGGHSVPHKELNGINVWSSDTPQPFTGMLDLPGNLKYHLSYEWLIPVIKKIGEVIPFKTIDECSEEEWFFNGNITKMNMRTPIHIAFEIVITWFNFMDRNPDLALQYFRIKKILI